MKKKQHHSQTLMKIYFHLLDIEEGILRGEGVQHYIDTIKEIIGEEIEE